MSGAGFLLPPDLLPVRWSRDRVHCPRPVTPLSATVLLPDISRGMSAGFAELGFGRAYHIRAINHWAYSTIMPVANGAATPGALPSPEVTAALVASLGERWDKEWLPAVRRSIDRSRAVEWPALSDSELLTAFREAREGLVDRWRIHGFVLFAYIGASEFETFYHDTFHPADATEPYRLLHGFPTVNTEAQRGLWQLSRIVHDHPKLLSLLDNHGLDTALHLLRGSSEGRTFLDTLLDYVEEYGWRADSVMELAEPLWRDDLTTPLAAVRHMARLAGGHDPDSRLARAAAERERLLAAARGGLAGRPQQLAHFDLLYQQAAYQVVVDEEHNFWIDQMGDAVMRLPVLEIGHRLAERGLLDQRDDVFYLHEQEVEAGLAGRDLRETAHARRRNVERWAAVSPPADIGDEGRDAGETVVDQFTLSMIKMDGVLRDQPLGSRLLRGHAGAPGIVSGPARVCLSLDEAFALEPGEILVCEMTVPTWTPVLAAAAGVVTDTGGVLSHSAIVAREVGIPCVAGLSNATRIITSGMRITVDGSAGTVHLEDEV